jgi:hypothetical protein
MIKTEHIMRPKDQLIGIKKMAYQRPNPAKENAVHRGANDMQSTKWVATSVTARLHRSGRCKRTIRPRAAMLEHRAQGVEEEKVLRRNLARCETTGGERLPTKPLRPSPRGAVNSKKAATQGRDAPTSKACAA